MRSIFDRDAIFTFALSNALLLISGGLTLFFSLHRVIRTALQAPTQPKAANQVLVFGHRLQQDGGLSTDYRQRLQRAAQLLSQRQCNVLLLGGVTRPNVPSEATAGLSFLRQLGIPAERVTTEDHSQHTLENLRRALPLLSSHRAEPVIVISNRYHLARVLTFARTMGLEALGCAAEDRPAMDIHTCWRYLREAYYLHWYVAGRHWASLTGNQRMLDRLR